MLRGRTLVLAWLVAPAAWLGIGLLGASRGVSVHGPLVGGWLVSGIVTALLLAASTLWWLTRERGNR